MELYRRTDFQHAGTGGCSKDGRPGGTGNDGIVKGGTNVGSKNQSGNPKLYGIYVFRTVHAVGLYFLLRPYMGTETVSWVCILGAAPFAALGFFKYHGMTAEQFLWAWFKSEFLIPKKLVFRSENLYYELLKGEIEAREKEELKKHD